MTYEEILRRLREIERREANVVRNPHAAVEIVAMDVPWLRKTVQQLLARLEKLETVAEAAREFGRTTVIVSATYIGTEKSPERVCLDVSRLAFNRLKEALAALKEAG